MDILAGFRNTGRDTTDLPPPQDNDVGDHGEQEPEDDELDTRPDTMDAAIADFSKRLGAQEQELYAGLHRALSHLPVPGKVEWEGAHSRKYQLLECRVHAHIDILKSVAGCTNNKDVFMCIVRFHACQAYCSTIRHCCRVVQGHIMRARCYPFNMRGHRFHNMNPQVHSQFISGYTRDILIIKKLCQGYT